MRNPEMQIKHDLLLQTEEKSILYRSIIFEIATLLSNIRNIPIRRN